MAEREKKFIKASSLKIEEIITRLREKVLAIALKKVDKSIKQRRQKYDRKIKIEIERYKQMLQEDYNEDFIEIQKVKITQLIESAHSLKFTEV